MVITDNMMPRMNGIELIKNIRTTKRQVPVVLITSELDDELTNEALTYGAFHCFKKPLDLDALETVIRKIFQIESCQNPSI
jgi:DNA-binding NtrC family response regulator